MELSNGGDEPGVYYHGLAAMLANVETFCVTNTDGCLFGIHLQRRSSVFRLATS
jgi:hypothetical protein